MNHNAIIHVLNNDLERIAIVDEYKTLSFTRNYNDIGEFIIEMNACSNQVRYLNRGDYILVNNDMSKFGLINEKTLEDNEDGTSTVTFRGNTLGVIFSWRKIIPKQNEVREHIQSNVESILYSYVDNHCVNSFDNARNIPFLTLAEDKRTGSFIRWESKETDLLSEIKTISEIYDYGFSVNLDIPNNNFRFEVYQGKDLTINNTEGNNPVVFSKEQDNIKSMKYTENTVDERTFAYTISNDEEGKIKLYETEKVSGMDRKEVLFNIANRDERDKYLDVPERAKNVLEEYAIIETVDAEIYDSNLFKYKRDYDLGDKVTVYNAAWDVLKNMRIISIEEVYNDEGLTIYARFGTRIKSLIDKIKRENKVFEL